MVQKKTLLNKNISLVIEFWPYGLKRTQSYAKLKRTLISSGFRSFFTLEETQKRYKLNEVNLDKIYLKLGENGNFTDLLIVK
jgi:hypothetical protein